MDMKRSSGSLLLEGGLYTASRFGGALLMLGLAFTAHRDASDSIALQVAQLAMVVPLAAALDGGASLSMLALASRSPAGVMRERRAIYGATLAWAGIVASLYFVSQFMLVTGDRAPASALLTGAAHFVWPCLTALVIVGLVCQRHLVAMGRTHIQAMIAAAITSVLLLLYVSDLISLIVAAYLLVIAPALADILLVLLFFRQQALRRGGRALIPPQEYAEKSHLERYIRGAAINGILQLVAVVAYLIDVRVLSYSLEPRDVSEYAFLQRICLVLVGAAGTTILPYWRHQGVAASNGSASAAHLRRDIGLAFVSGTVLAVAFSSAIFGASVNGLLGSMAEYNAVLMLGFASQIVVGIVGATVGAHFAHSARRSRMLLFVLLAIGILITFKVTLIPDNYILLPLVSGLAVLVCSILPQIYFVWTRNRVAP
jgi:hypothetical protein